MTGLRQLHPFRVVLLAALVAFGLSATPGFAADVTTPFAGKDVNGGTVTHEMKGGKHMLSVSADFKVPGSPDPHWQVVDSKGNVYLLDRLKLKDDKINTSIDAPRPRPGHRDGPDVVLVGGGRARRGVIQEADRDGEPRTSRRWSVAAQVFRVHAAGRRPEVNSHRRTRGGHTS